MTKMFQPMSPSNRMLTVLIAVLGLALPDSLATAAEKPPAVGEAAKDFELASLNGEKVKLSRLTHDGPVVLVVLRGYPGYQCPLCTRQFGDFLGKADAFRKAGSKVVFIYVKQLPQPTHARPGTEAKLVVLAERARRGGSGPSSRQDAGQPGRGTSLPT